MSEIVRRTHAAGGHRAAMVAATFLFPPIRLGNWRGVGGGEAGHVVSDQSDPNIVFSEFRIVLPGTGTPSARFATADIAQDQHLTTSIT